MIVSKKGNDRKEALSATNMRKIKKANTVLKEKKAARLISQSTTKVFRVEDGDGYRIIKQIESSEFFPLDASVDAIGFDVAQEENAE